MALFGREYLVSGLLPKELGRSLKRAEDFRLQADYTSELPPANKVARLVADAAEFVGIVAGRLRA